MEREGVGRVDRKRWRGYRMRRSSSRRGGRFVKGEEEYSGGAEES
jgi:hypothetical protein